MFPMLNLIVKQLKNLEAGQLFELALLEKKLVKFNVFLIGSCCDKPAQSLVQNVNECIGAYGCGRCEIQDMYKQKTI
ncbi:unnamed protein product [Didymodactylos carnosus]|uniref:Uncharacterized protein n=1 Tax=Didymodactylos carnosus TaxID=1234261 RepID=A0A816CMX9_9BILA|nr:unnamed protein product [Didymodactylos carnosus]CAF4515150.1 unnamed protein product [Didymodactylos carnosus]